MSTAFTKLINDEIVRSKLESEDFVAIKVQSDSEAYMQFAAICKVSLIITINSIIYRCYDEKKTF